MTNPGDRPGWVRDETTGVELPLPSGFTPLADDRGRAAMVIAPADWPDGAGPRPTVTVTTRPHAAGVPSAARVASETLRELAQRPGTHLVADELSGRQERVLAWTATDGPDVTVHTQRVVVGPHSTILLTASVDVLRYVELQDALRAVLDGARFDDGIPSPPDDRAPAPPATDTDLEQLDPELAPVEDLGWIGAAQQFRPSGTTVDPEPLAQWLRTGRGRGRPALRGLGIAGLRGHSTARRLRSHVRDADLVVRAEATLGPWTFVFQAWRSGPRALVVCSDGPSQWTAADAAVEPAGGRAGQQVRLSEPSAALVPVLLASWAGVGPSWSVQPDEDVAVWDEALLAERLTKPRLPPPDRSNEQVRQVWERITARWTLAVETRSGTGGQSTFCAAGDRGHLQLFEADGGADEERRVQAVPSMVLFGHLVERLLAAAT